MPSTRRRFLIGSGSAVGLLSGCTRFGDSTVTVEELEVELVNGTDDRHAFHFAVETADGLGEWESREVAPQTRESVVREPAESRVPLAVHGVVDDHPTRGELYVSGAEPGELCLRVVFEYGLGAVPTFLQSSDVSCER